MSDPSPIDRLRAALLADEAAQLAIAPLVDITAFLDAITAYADRLGLAIGRDAFARGLGRAATPQAQLQLPALVLADAPPRQWLPVDVKRHQSGIMVEWLHFAGQPLTESFFEETIRRVRALPFNRLMRCATPLSALDAFAGAPPPDGLVFHMSRCGSTLVGQMLGAAPDHIILSEPPVLDTMVQLAGRGAVPTATVHAMAAALIRDRTGEARHRVLKLDPWHILVRPMFRSLWPDTPWIFLYRDPIEVLVSQQRRPGMHVRRGVLPLNAYGVDPAEAAGWDNYAVWILDRICRAALDHHDARGLLLNYSQLPGAFAETILPHFGINPGPEERAAMAVAGTRYSKGPNRSFTSDSDAKQRAASEALRAAARPLIDTFARIEDARLAWTVSSAAAIARSSRPA